MRSRPCPLAPVTVPDLSGTRPRTPSHPARPTGRRSITQETPPETETGHPEPAPAGRSRPHTHTHDGTTAGTPTPAPHAPTCPSPCRKPGGRT
ncbi:hypothetical protein ACVWXU_000234 [Streptomyces sp. TE33382]